jgi:hypothetical protein
VPFRVDGPPIRNLSRTGFREIEGPSPGLGCLYGTAPRLVGGYCDDSSLFLTHRDIIEAVKTATLFDNLKQPGTGKRTTVSWLPPGGFPHRLSVSLWFIKTLDLSPYFSKTWRPATLSL